MSLVSEYFSACTTARLEADDVYLPLDAAATADLVNILSAPEAYIILSISNERTQETVRARNESGIILLDRGFAGTTAVLHRFGSTVCSVSPTVLAVIKDLICNYSCCENSPCPCAPVAFAGATLPPATIGKPWEGSIIFAGDLPIVAGVNNTPPWMSATQQGNFIKLAGTPTGAGTYSFSAAAANCNGTELVTQTLSVTVTT